MLTAGEVGVKWNHPEDGSLACTIAATCKWVASAQPTSPRLCRPQLLEPCVSVTQREGPLGSCTATYIRTTALFPESLVQWVVRGHGK